MYVVSILDGADNVVYRALISNIIGTNASLHHILDKCVEFSKNDNVASSNNPYHIALHYKLSIIDINNGDSAHNKMEPIYNERFLRTFKGVLSILQKTDVIMIYRNNVSTYITTFFREWFNYMNDNFWHIENGDDIYQNYIFPAISSACIKFNYDSTTHIYKNGTKACYNKFVDTAYKLYQKEDKNKTLSKEQFKALAESTYVSMCNIPKLVVISKEY